MDQLMFNYPATDTCGILSTCYILQMEKSTEVDKIKGDTKSQDAGHTENDDSLKVCNPDHNDSLKAPPRQAALLVRRKINELMENNALNVLFNVV